MDADTPAFGESGADSVLDYELVDYAFDGPRSARGPKLLFRAKNTGTEPHELEVLDSAGEPVGEVEAMPPATKAPSPWG